MNRCFFGTGLIALFAVSVSAQPSIPVQDAAKHVGENVKICGKIEGGKFLDQSNNQPTLLDMGANYPNQLLTLLIWGEDRKKFSQKPELFFLDKQICVTGELKNYKGKPEIIVRDTTQIKILQ